MQTVVRNLAREAYRAYGLTTGFKNFRGEPIPHWVELPEQIQKAWENAANEVLHFTHGAEKLTLLTTAMACHEANRAIQVANGEEPSLPWAESPTEMRGSTVQGVLFAWKNPDLTPKDQHESWVREKKILGWVYGEEKDPENKTHPCLVPYEDLPVLQQLKDSVFRAIALSFRP